jgi:hypothetical protein
MTDPVTVGGLVVLSIKMVAPEVLKAAVGEAVKDAYRELKQKIGRWASSELATLEAAPDSKNAELVVAEIIDAQPVPDKNDLRDLAENLLAKLKERAPPIGLDIARIEDLQMELGKVDVESGVGVRIQDARGGSLKVRDVSVGHKSGN